MQTPSSTQTGIWRKDHHRLRHPDEQGSGADRAAWLFGLPEDKIQIVVQRESIIHSAVQFADHSIIAQLGVPDMRIPIQYALTWPERLPSPVPELDFTALTS